MTSWAAYYLSLEHRRDFESVMASSTRAISWISAEHPSVVSDLHNTQAPKSESPDIARVGVVLYPGRGSISDRQFVGWSHNHGAWIDWHLDRLANPRFTRHHVAQTAAAVGPNKNPGTRHFRTQAAPALPHTLSTIASPSWKRLGNSWWPRPNGDTRSPTANQTEA